MNITRIVILIVALGAGGSALFMSMAGGNNGGSVDIAAAVPRPSAPKVAMKNVLFASDDIPQGAVLSDAVTDWVEWPAKRVPEFYITEDDAAFVEALPEMRARQAIRAGEPIYGQNTVRHGDRGMMAAIMTPGMRAVTARVTVEQISGGFILPGDRVDIFATGRNVQDPNAGPQSRIILSNVRVLAIDQIAATEEDINAIPGRTVTMELSPTDVPVFLQSRDQETLTLVLRSVFEGAIPSGQADRTTPDEVIVIRYGQG